MEHNYETVMGNIELAGQRGTAPQDVIDMVSGAAILLDFEPQQVEDSVRAIRKHVKGAGTLVEIRQQFKAVRKDVEKEAGTSGETPELITAMEELNKKFGLVLHGTKSAIVQKKFDHDMEYYVFTFPSTSSIKEMEMNNLVWVETSTGPKAVKVFDKWMQWAGRRTYNDVIFQPDNRTIAQPGLPDGDMLNLWQGFTVAPVKGDWSLISNHILHVWCDGNRKLYHYVIRWLARLCQKPGEPGETNLVLRSGQRTGKGIVIDMLAEIMGVHGLIAASHDDITGRFNNHLAYAVFINANEAVWGGNKQHSGVYKQLVTDKYRLSEEKFLSRKPVRNRSSLVVSTNSGWAMPADLDDGRGVYLDVSHSRVGDRAYFRALGDHIKNGGKAAFLFSMLEMNLDSFEVRDLPEEMGASKLQDQLQTEESVVGWWYECLQEGAIGFESAESLLNERQWATTLLPSLKKSEVYASYLEYCTRHREYDPRPKTWFFADLKNKCGGKGFNAQHRETRGGPRELQIHDLQTMRQAFSDTVKTKVDWPSLDDELIAEFKAAEKQHWDNMRKLNVPTTY